MHNQLISNAVPDREGTDDTGDSQTIVYGSRERFVESEETMQDCSCGEKH